MLLLFIYKGGYMGLRGFEVVSSFIAEKINIPVRQTIYSAGYDLAACGDYTIEPGQIVRLSTGLKAYMQNDEFLGIHIRSSLAIKKQIILVNAQGIIDKDYYNNLDNEGHIIVALMNIGSQMVSIKNGERVAQGIFYKYLLTDDDNASNMRLSGVGSTGV